MGYRLTRRSASGKFNNSVPRKSITIHHWDDPEKRPTFEGTVNWLAQPSVKASIHFVAEDGRVCAMVPENKGAWHSGNSEGNNTSLSIECNPRMTQGDLETVAELIAYLRRKYGNLPLRAHKSWTSTSCPGAYANKLGWLSERANQINRKKVKPPVKTPAPSTSSPTGSFLVKVKARELNIRSGPGTTHSVVGSIKNKGIYTITEASNGWGRLKSGKGWISLSYTDRVTPASVPTRKSDYVIAREVIAGKWGNGDVRKKRLETAGYDYKKIQTIINKLVK